MLQKTVDKNFPYLPPCIIVALFVMYHSLNKIDVKNLSDFSPISTHREDRLRRGKYLIEKFPYTSKTHEMTCKSESNPTFM